MKKVPRAHTRGQVMTFANYVDMPTLSRVLANMPRFDFHHNKIAIVEGIMRFILIIRAIGSNN